MTANNDRRLKLPWQWRRDCPGTIDLASRDKSIWLTRVGAAFRWRDNQDLEHSFETAGASGGAVTAAGRVVFGVPSAPRFEWRIQPEGRDLIFSAAIVNTTAATIRVQSLAPLSLNFRRGSTGAVNGPLTQAYMLCPHEAFMEMRYYYIYEELYEHDRLSANAMTCLFSHDRQHALTLGFITTADLSGRIVLDFNKTLRVPLSLQAGNEAEGTPLAPGQRLASEQLWLNLDDPAPRGIERWAARLGKAMRARRRWPAPVGWSTWDYYFENISERVVLDNARKLRECRADLPLAYIQIDAGYCNAERDWRNWDRKKFPHGPRWLVRQIKAQGFKAGLWLVPFYAHENSRVARRHPGWLVRDAGGEPLRIWRRWHVLDGTHPQVQRWLKKLARTITLTWGFDYIKIDGASMIGSVAGVHYDPQATGCQAYRRGVAAFRSGMRRNTFFMGGLFWPSVGLVDAMRIGEDVGARWDWSRLDVHHGERDRYHGSGHVKRAIAALLNGAFLHRRLWINDGDYLVVRDDRSELTRDEARTWAVVTGLAGGSVILSDNLPTLAHERLDILRKIFPVYPGAGRPVDFLQHPIPELLAADIRRPFEQWTVLAVINYADAPAVKTVAFDQLGLDARREYHVHGFWEQHYYGCLRQRVAINLRPHACEILSLRAARRVPQVIGTDLHITQGAVELDGAQWRAAGQLTLRLKSPGQRSGRVHLHVPPGWRIIPARMQSISRVMQPAGEVVTLAVTIKRRLDVALRFARG